MQLWSSVKTFITHRTLAFGINVPVFHDAVLAEVVSAWYRDWISEHVQTDAAPKLILREETAPSCHVYTLRTKVKV